MIKKPEIIFKSKNKNITLKEINEIVKIVKSKVKKLVY